MSVVLPGGAIGVLGGGQLGRMIALEARRMGYKVWVLDPDETGPMAQVADGVIAAPFDSQDAARELAQHADVVTVEFENIPAEIVALIEKVKPVRPSSSVLRMIQDRMTQKRFLEDHGFPQTRYVSVKSKEEIAKAANFPMPAILKSCRLGYDGKGQVRLSEAGDLAPAWENLKSIPAVLEEFVQFEREISVVLARGTSGEVRAFPIAENVHRKGILHTTRVPAAISPKIEKKAVELASGIAQAMDHIGVMAVEMFVKPDGEILVNEIAPRVHNSGHYTFGACATSQFEQHVRAVCGLPLGDPSLLKPVVMVNLLGDLWQGGTPQWEAVLRNPNMHLHLYGKAEARPGRKMGHILIFDDDTDRALSQVDKLLMSVKAGD